MHKIQCPDQMRRRRSEKSIRPWTIVMVECEKKIQRSGVGGGTDFRASKSPVRAQNHDF